MALSGPDGDALTFRALRELVERQAGHLCEAGIHRSSRIAVVTRGGVNGVVHLLSVMRCAIAIPLNPDYRHAEFLKAFQFLKVDFLLWSADLPAEAISAAREAGIRVAEAGRSESRPRASVPLPDPHHIAVVMQTSGTTGDAKRVPLSHANLQASARNIRQSMYLGPEDRFLCMASLHHIAGIGLVLASLTAGSETHCVPALPAARFFDVFQEFRPTWFWAAPAMLARLLPRAEAQRKGFGALRFIRSGSAALTPQMLEQAERAFHVPVLENYGMTEAAPQITSSPLPPSPLKPGSAGVAAGTEIRIADEAGAPLPVGAEGEILIRGDSVMSGYEEDAPANATAFVDGWFRTGDCGRLDADGYLYLAGRTREMINRGGEKVWPREVEEVLLLHPQVAEAVVFAIPHPVLSETVAAAVVLRHGNLSALDLRRFAAARLAEFKIPAWISVVAEIPRGPGGKPRRHLLAASAGLRSKQGDSQRATMFQAPATALEKQLAAIWSMVLSVELIGVDEDFFVLGGDSLAGNQLLNEIQQQLGCGNSRMERFDFFNSPTIASQARSLAKTLAALAIVDSATATPRPPEICYVSPAHTDSIGNWSADPDRPPVFIVPWIDSGGEYLVDLARALGGDWPFCVLLNPEPDDSAMTIESLADRLARTVLLVQPQGPYVLAGHCFGGVVAYQIARHLQSMGHKVRLLALIDAPTPGYPAFLRHPQLFAAGIAVYLFRVLRGPEKSARLRFGAAALLRHLAKQNRIRRISPSDQPGPSLRAMRMYRPQPMRVPSLVLISREHVQTGSPLDRRRGWLRFITPQPRFAVISGDHASILSTRQVGDLACHLKLALQGQR